MIKEGKERYKSKAAKKKHEMKESPVQKLKEIKGNAKAKLRSKGK